GRRFGGLENPGALPEELAGSGGRAVAVEVTMRRIPAGVLCIFACALPLDAQSKSPRIFYFPKPVKATPYQPPMKPLVRLADLKARHWGATNWSELVIADTNTRARVISAAPGSKVIRHLHPDSPEWWVVQEGRIRFEIESPEGKFQPIEPRKASHAYPSH